MKKNIFRTVVISAVFAITFTGCQKTEIESEHSFKVTFDLSLPEEEPEPESKTVFHGDKIWWTVGDQITFFQVATVGGTPGKLSSASNKARTADVEVMPAVTLSFSAPDQGTEVIYYSVAPKDAYQAYASKNGVYYPRMTLPDTQVPTLVSYDPKADLLISEYITSDAATTKLQMKYARPNAIAKMSLKNIGLSENDAVKTVKFSALDNGKDVILAGSAFFDLVNSKYANLTSASCTSIPTITLDYSTLSPAEDFTAYFICRPFKLASGDSFKVEIITKNGMTFTKDVVLGNGRSLELKAAYGSVFSVDFDGIIGVTDQGA